MRSLIPQNSWMSRSPLPSGRPGGLGGLGNGLAYFVDADGNRITSVECGQPFDFRVDGFPRVHLVQTKDGQPQFDGMMDIPMGYWTPSCWSDPGLYHGAVYDPYVGALLSEYDFTITGSPVSGITSMLGGSTGVLVAGAALLFFLMRRR